MTIDEAIKDIKDNIKPVVGGISLDMAIDALEKQRWIPCSERLPEDDEDVLVQMTDYSMMIDSRTASSSGWFWAEKDDLPIAWMPLPEPYQEGEQK